MSTDFSSIDRLVEFGMGMAIAQQMVNTMNHAMNNAQVPGVCANSAISLNPNQPQRQWYAVIDGNIAGPMDTPQTEQLIRMGKISSDTFLWQPGMAGWTLAREIPEAGKLLLLNGASL